MKCAIKFAIIALAATTTNAQTEDDDRKIFEAIGMLPAPGKISSTISGTYGLGPNYTFDEAVLPCSECKRGKTFTLHMPIANTTYNCDPVDHPLLSGSKICGDGNCGQMYGEMGIRNITVYIPAAYKDGDEVGVMVLQDGDDMLPVISNVMDRFIGSDDEEHSLPTFVVVAVAVAGPYQTDFAFGPLGGTIDDCGNGMYSERTLEYSTVSKDYAQFVSDEVLPYVSNHQEIRSKYPNLNITDDPSGRASFGESKGGATAIRMAFLTPELFGTAIAYHPNLGDLNSTASNRTEFPGEMEALWRPGGPELIKNSDLKPIRIFHASSDRDLGTPKACLINMTDGSDTDQSMVYQSSSFAEANNKTQEALVAKGYNTRYAFGMNSCHGPQLLFQDMPNTLVWAWSDWKKKQDAKKTGDDSLAGTNSGSPKSSRVWLSLLISISIAIGFFILW